jgi:CBS domain-containing protein
MLLSEILRIKGNVLFTTPPERPVIEAVNVMAQHDIGSLVVMDHGRMAGMLTFAEVLKALAERAGSLGDLRVDAICVRDPVTASPGLDVMELRRVML